MRWGGVGVDTQGGLGVGWTVELKLNIEKKKRNWLPTRGCDPLPPDPPRGGGG